MLDDFCGLLYIGINHCQRTATMDGHVGLCAVHELIRQCSDDDFNVVCGYD